MRKTLFALLAVVSLMVAGCGEKKETAPPPGADTAETPNVEIDPGIEAPGEGDTGETEEGEETGE